jgi:hypothetical protein
MAACPFVRMELVAYTVRMLGRPTYRGGAAQADILGQTYWSNAIFFEFESKAGSIQLSFGQCRLSVQSSGFGSAVGSNLSQRR